MCHHLDNAFTLQETQILNLSFSLKGLVFFVVVVVVNGRCTSNRQLESRMWETTEQNKIKDI